jgi:hypothetical protein
MGYWGKNLVRNFDALGALAVICDEDGSREAAVHSAYPAARFTPDYQSVLADPGVEGVVVATPAALHYRMARAAMEAGKDVFVEKPLALSAAEGADLRRPGIHGRFGLTNERGFSTVVNDDAVWRDLLQQPADFPYLNVLVAGPASRRAADRAGGALDKLLEEAKQEYDLVIIDSPPLLGFAEPLQMAALVDGVVVITLAGQTSRDALASVINNLRRLRARVIGVALNEVRQDMSDRYYYYGYYGKYYSRYYKPTNN